MDDSPRESQYVAPAQHQAVTEDEIFIVSLAEVWGGGVDEEAVLYKKELLLTSNGPMSSQPTPMCFNPLCARWEPKEGGRREGSPKPVPLKKELKPLPPGWGRLLSSCPLLPLAVCSVNLL